MVFQRDHYFNSLIDIGLKEKTLVLNAKSKLIYTYQELTQDSFEKKYSSKGWLTRKINVLFKAPFSFAGKTSYYLLQALGAKITNKGTTQAYVFKARREITEAFGWFITLFNDRLGQFYVQESVFHKNCYDCFINGKISSTLNKKNSNTRNSLNTNEENKTEIKNECISSFEDKYKQKESEINKLENIKELDSGIIEYNKDSKAKNHRKTNTVISSSKDAIGSGVNGTVYFVKNNKKLVVKKSFEKNLENEYKISKNFNHENLISARRLIIKTDLKKKENEQKKYKLEMDFVPGITLLKLKGQRKIFNRKELKDQILQIKNCCLYLYDIDVVWQDLNTGNLIVDENNKLKFIDYEFWYIEKGEDKIRELLINSIGVIKEFIGSSEIKNHSASKDIENKILCSKQPSKINPIDPENPLFIPDGLIKGKFSVFQSQFIQNLDDLISKKTNKEGKQILEYYFDRVLENIEIFYP